MRYNLAVSLYESPCGARGDGLSFVSVSFMVFSDAGVSSLCGLI